MKIMNLNNLTKAELAGLVAELAQRVKEAEGKPAKTAKAREPKRVFRIVNAEKACQVRTPLTGTPYAKGYTFATWFDGEVKRRAYNGGAWLVVDTRGLDASDVADIAKAWNARAKGTRQTVEGVECVVFTKAGK